VGKGRDTGLGHQGVGRDQIVLEGGSDVCIDRFT
jgi:hypothetical protein